MYPDKPSNYMVVDGIDIFDAFGMVLGDGYVMSPPEPKTFTVDIPGASGALDLTESLLGDVPYNNRKQSFTFYIIDVSDPVGTKKDMINFFHGKRHKYFVSMDPAYTFDGRFTISDITQQDTSAGMILTIPISIDANPYKMKGDHIIRASGVGGKVVDCISGRMPVHPVIETSCDTTIVYNGKEIKVPAGTWTLYSITFKQGYNQLYINTYQVYNLLWPGDDSTITWGYMRSKPIYELCKESSGSSLTVYTWGMLVDEKKTWGDAANENVHWRNWSYATADASNISDVYIKYEWGDL